MLLSIKRKYVKRKQELLHKPRRSLQRALRFK